MLQRRGARVRAYCFDFIGRDGSIASYDVGVFDSASDAEGYARQALPRADAVAVEVWTEGARVARIAGDARLAAARRAYA
jgi:hypothetical protein